MVYKINQNHQPQTQFQYGRKKIERKRKLGTHHADDSEQQEELASGTRKPIHPLGMVGRYHFLGGHVHADVDKEPDVELALVCHSRHRLAGDDVATKEGRKARHNLYGQSLESRVDVHRKRRDGRNISHGHLCQKHDANAAWSMYPDGDWCIHHRYRIKRPKDKDIRLEHIVCHHDGILSHRVHERRLLLVLHCILPRIHRNAGHTRLSFK